MKDGNNQKLTGSGGIGLIASRINLEGPIVKDKGSFIGSVKEGVRFFNEKQPVDLIFSDIQLGDGLSFEIFKTAKIDAPIIFCTAYDEYALEAIRSNGIEYILKPFTEDSVKQAIQRYQQLKKHFVISTVDYEKVINAITGGGHPQKQVTSVLVYQRDKIMPIGLDEIALFYIQGDAIWLHCFNGRSHVINQPLDELERLAQNAFFRINRQYLVNRKAVLDAHHYENRKYVVNLTVHFKEVLVVTKNRATDFLEWLMK